MSQSQNCEALAITCIDFRFISQVRDYLTQDEKLEGKYDLVTVPGSSLNFDKIEGSIDISFKLHQPEAVYIFDHEDCGAYGPDNSLERHRENLQKAKDTIRERYPDVFVETFMATFSGVRKPS
ncbi:MAG: carbonic anhydrase [Candidatus Woykebacteria bacterium]